MKSNNAFARKLRLLGESVLHYVRHNLLLIILCVLALLVFFVSKETFGATDIFQIANQVSHIAIVAAGMTFVVLVGEADLSVGAVAAFGSVVCALLMRSGVPSSLSVAAALFLCAVWGAVNGFIVSRFHLPAFLITLLMAKAIGTISSVLSGGLSVSISWSNRGFIALMRMRVLGIPMPLIIMLAINILCAVCLNSTKLGRSVHAVGGNPQAAKLSGIHVSRVRFTVFIISAVLAGLGGIVWMARMMAGMHNLGSGWEVDALAAVVLGGAQIKTGEGNIVSTLLGAILISFITNIQSVAGWLSQWHGLVTAALIIVIMMINNSSLKQRFVLGKRKA